MNQKLIRQQQKNIQIVQIRYATELISIKVKAKKC